MLIVKAEIEELLVVDYSGFQAIEKPYAPHDVDSEGVGFGEVDDGLPFEIED